MRRLALACALVAAVLAGVLLLVTRDESDAAASPHQGVGTLTRAERDRILHAAEAASTATSRAALVAEGRRLFRSTDLAKAGESCQSCHVDGGGTNAELGTIPHPQEEGDFTGPRDVPALWNVKDTPPYGWDGKEADLSAFVAGTIRSHYKDGDAQPQRVAALVAYLETLAPPRSTFDQGTTMSAAARRGEDLFQGKGGCMGCHAGPDLTDNALHDTRVPKIEDTDTDPGHARSGALRGTFNTPQLRDLRATAPYMHNGSLKNLRAVVEFYDRRSSVSPLGLSEPEVDDLVAYLESL